MTSEQISDLCETTIELLDDNGYCADDKTIATTSDTLADFVAQWGAGKTDARIKTPNRYWSNIQKNGAGSERGTLIVLDFGDIRVANFA